MTIRHLKTFIAVCEYGGITKAAEKLHIAQPAVSQTIAEIEKYYNLILFERISQRLVITEFGKILFAKARDVVSSFDDFENTANQSELNVTLRVGASLTIGKMYIPKFLTVIKQLYPNLQPYVVINKTSVIEEKIVNGSLDFALVEGQIFSAHLRSQVFSEDKLIAVCGINYSVPDKITIDELKKYDLLLRDKGSASRDFLDNVLLLQGLIIQPMLESASNQAVISSAIENHGIAILPQKLVQPFLKSKRLKKIEIAENDFKREYYIVSHKNKKFSPLQKEIFELCKNIYN